MFICSTSTLSPALSDSDPGLKKNAQLGCELSNKWGRNFNPFNFPLRTEAVA
jgi:hypothetical protein